MSFYPVVFGGYQKCSDKFISKQRSNEDITFDVLNEGTIKPDMVGMWRTRLQGSVLFTSRKLGRECWMESRLFMLFSNGKRPLRCLWQATKSTKSNAVNHAEDIRRQKKQPPYNWLGPGLDHGMLEVKSIKRENIQTLNKACWSPESTSQWSGLAKMVSHDYWFRGVSPDSPGFDRENHLNLDSNQFFFKWTWLVGQIEAQIDGKGRTYLHPSSFRVGRILQIHTKLSEFLFKKIKLGYVIYIQIYIYIYTCIIIDIYIYIYQKSSEYVPFKLIDFPKPWLVEPRHTRDTRGPTLAGWSRGVQGQGVPFYTWVICHTAIENGSFIIGTVNGIRC